MQILKTVTTLLFSSFLLMISSQVHADLLDVDDAFQLQEPVVENGEIVIQWQIADDYKLYKDKVSVRSDDLALKTPNFSPAKMVDDALFGKTEVYVHQATVKVPYQTGPDSGTIAVKYQGCADKIGVCYPPQTREFNISLPATKPSPSAAGDANAFGSLSELNEVLNANNAQPELLEADQAFKFHAQVQNGEVIAQWQIADDYHLYQDKIKVRVIQGEADLNKLILPEAEVIDDPLFGQTAVYHGNLQATLPVAKLDGKATFEFEFQGCSASAGVCYPPIRKTFEVNAVNLNTKQAASVSLPSDLDTSSGESLSETDQIADTLKSSSVWLVIATFFIFGLLLAFTPCVFPMIPILSSIIVGQGDQLTTRRAFVMSLVYVLAMSVTYTTAGVLAGIFGENLQAAFQNPWIIGSFSVIFILLAFSMFGFYELQLPNSLQSKLTNLSNKQQGGTLTGVAIMGFLSALIVGPCVAPPLAGALIYIGQTGDALLGGTALFAMSMGMGLPLLLLGTSAGKLLPRAGGWMDAVKAVFGVMLIGVAIWMAERILPFELIMLSWALLFIISAVYMGAFESSAEKSGWFKLFRGIGLVLALYGTLLLIGLAGGSNSLFQPLKVFQSGAGGAQQAESHLTFKTIKSIDELETELAKGQPVMLDFYADWCVTCKEMEALTFTDDKVHAALEGVTLLQADVTANDAIDKALMKQYGIIGPPAILFFNPRGEEQKAQRVIGFKNAEDFTQMVQKAFQ